MLFNSYEFIFVFLPITFFLYFYLNKKKLTKASKNILVFSSLLFYSCWNILYLPIICLSILFNYTIGNMLNNEAKYSTLSKKTILTFGISVNIILLVYFKYVDFFIENLNFLTDSSIANLNLALPLAISFFTFQQITYLVDSYRRETKEYDFLNYSLFVTFFPQLIAGPIVHHKEMMPQFHKIKNKVVSYRNIAMGLFIFSIGLFKKVVIADTFAIWANFGFDTAKILNIYEAWATSLSYTFQIYFDFSGYTDMAIGIALLFNIKLPINFNSPYKATNIQDFWRRWHITLSRFLKNYVYIPLGGNKAGEINTYINLLATFIIGGIWHGAGWTFLFWGFLHGIALVINRSWNKIGFKIWKWLSWFITFNFINIAFVFFRAKQWDDAIKILNWMFSIDNFVFNTNYIKLIALFFSFIIILFFKNSMCYYNNKFQFSIKKIFILVILITISILAIRIGNSNEFLYFNF